VGSLRTHKGRLWAVENLTHAKRGCEKFGSLQRQVTGSSDNPLRQVVVVEETCETRLPIVEFQF
jgi:hypothetical protein